VPYGVYQVALSCNRQFAWETNTLNGFVGELILVYPFSASICLGFQLKVSIF